MIKLNGELDKWCILHGYRGSIAHEMYVPNSDPNSVDDKDTMAIIVLPIEYYFGLKTFGHRDNRVKEIKEGEWDTVIYGIKKFVSLLLKSNPNVLSLLWLKPHLYIKLTEAGQLLIDNRDIFISKNIYHSFNGYAYGQLKRMTHLACKGYMGEKRKKLVEKFGYDTKNAAHLIRLLRMGIETLTDGKIHVARQDNHQLLEIKKGEWSLKKVQKTADRLFKLCEEAYIKSKLPNQPDFDKANKLCCEIIKMVNSK